MDICADICINIKSISLRKNFKRLYYEKCGSFYLIIFYKWTEEFYIKQYVNCQKSKLVNEITPLH